MGTFSLPNTRINMEAYTVSICIWLCEPYTIFLFKVLMLSLSVLCLLEENLLDFEKLRRVLVKLLEYKRLMCNKCEFA